MIESFRPFHFSHLLARSNSPLLATSFFLLNFCLSLLIWALENLLETPQRKVFFQIFSEMLFFIPGALIGLILFSLGLYLLSVILGGKASFSHTFSTMGFSSFPLIVLFVPYLSPIALIWWCFLLVFAFKKIHGYRFSFAIISVVGPFLVIGAFMLATGFIKMPSINL